MGLANSLFPRQLDEDGSRPWKWNFESSDSDHTLVIVKRNSSVSSPCHHVIVWLKFSGNSPHPPFKCSIVLRPTPESKLSDFLFTECELFDWRLQRYRPLHLCYLQWIDMKMIIDHGLLLIVQWVLWKLLLILDSRGDNKDQGSQLQLNEPGNS